MAVAVTMPELGESVTEGTVTRWLKEVGDTVELDEPLLEVSTDKVETEIPAPAAGTLLDRLVAENEVVEVGGTLAMIGGSDGEKPSAGSGGAGPTATKTAPAADQPAPRVRADAEPSPAPRAVSAEHDRPSGPQGRVRPADDERKEALATGPSIPQPARRSSAPEKPIAGRVVPLSRLRRIIAQRMTASLATSAQLTTVQEVDVTPVARLRAAHKADFERREGVKLTFLPFIAKAVIEALGSFPAVNATISEDGTSVTYHAGVNLAIAVDTPRGLLVPVIRDAHELSVAGLARRIADVAERTRNNTISADELSGGTFTITNIGSVGALFDTPIINQPQVAILATGAVFRRPAVVTDSAGEDQIAIRSFCYLPMTYDHRLIDGADAGRFVGAVRARLEEGSFENDLG
jgi:pyruvate dehydrogenase E2 component (dihydrolipoamide acetyltransferase)